MARVVAACDLDLGLLAGVPRLDPVGAAFLDLDPCARFAFLVGEGSGLRGQRRPRLDELRRLAAWTRLSFRGRSAVGYWLPDEEAAFPLSVDAPRLESSPPLRPRPEGELFALVHPAPPPRPGSWHARLFGDLIGVEDPLSLAQRLECADVAGRLRAVAGHLDEADPGDGGQRRLPAHRIGQAKGLRPR